MKSQEFGKDLNTIFTDPLTLTLHSNTSIARVYDYFKFDNVYSRPIFVVTVFEIIMLSPGFLKVMHDSLLYVYIC